jgi:hypothetical protein
LSEFGIFAWSELVDQLGFQQSLDGAIKRAWAKTQAAASLVGDLPHDAVAVEVFACEGEKDLESGGRERIEFAFWHKRSIISISIIDYKSLETVVQYVFEARSPCSAGKRVKAVLLGTRPHMKNMSEPLSGAGDF